MPNPKLTRESRYEFEDEIPMSERLRCRDAFDPDDDPAGTEAMRGLMYVIGAPAVCHRGRCRRADLCLAPKVDCAFIHAAWLEAYIFPDLEQAAPQPDGPGTRGITPPW